MVEAARAIKELESLIKDAAALRISREDDSIDLWNRKVRVVLIAAFGEKDSLVAQHDAITYCPSWVSSAADYTADFNAKISGIKDCCNNMESAIYRLNLEIEEADQLPSATHYDPELWTHVESLVRQEKWDMLPAQVSIFLEDRIRKWAKEPTAKNGGRMVGKTLMATAFGENGLLRLGSQNNESEGWRNLATGFTQAVSNVARHRLSDRDDARQYAIGVLGLASLILTQVRYELEDTLKESQRGELELD